MLIFDNLTFVFQVRVFFQEMKEAEQNIERSKSADDVVADRPLRQEEFPLQPRSLTSDHLCRGPKKSEAAPRGPGCNHTLLDHYHMVTPGVPFFGGQSKRDGMVLDTCSMGESVEGISIGGFSDNDGLEDDISDSESDNEWEGCEVTHV